MNKLYTLFLLFLHCACVLGSNHYVGGDISLLPEYEKAGAQYKTQDGTPITDLLPWLKQQGMNAMRVRLFVNPEAHKANYPQKYDPNACQDLEYIIPLCKRIVDEGMDLMLDFHYSDTWADPAKQWTPEDWKNLSDDELYQKIYDYTKETLLTLKANGIIPAFIQPGNEISYGMLWGAENANPSTLKKALMGSDANWQRFGDLLNRAIAACKEVCPDAKIVLHTERVAQPNVLTNFYNQMQRMDVDYDIIGLSYYPYWHGDMSALSTALTQLEKNFPEKNVMIVETGYSYKWAVPGTEHDYSKKWSYSEEGQNAFAKDLVDTLEQFQNADGLFWWWMEYNAYGTNLQGWYNAPLFDSTTGKACRALTTICSYANSNAVEGTNSNIASDTEVWYDLYGCQIKDADYKGTAISNKGNKMILH